MLKGFKEFILRGNVLDLAIAVVIGGAFGTLVTALVTDLITPLIGVIGGQPDFSNFVFTVNNSTFLIGDFLNALISFLLVTAVIYFAIVLPMNNITARIKRGERVDPTEKTCPECLAQIPVKARRCMYCTSLVKNNS